MSVRKRTWQPAKGKEKTAWIVDYKDLSGKRRQKTFDKKKDADRYWEVVRQEIRDGTHVPASESITVAEAAELWLTDCEQNHKLERSTLDGYKAHVRLHILPFLGRVLLTGLTYPRISKWQDDLIDLGRSTNLTERLLVDLGAILSVAQGRGLVGRNVVYEMRRNTRVRKKRAGGRRRKAKAALGVEIPTIEEIRIMQENCPPAWAPHFLTLVFAGLRSSELRGLPWSSVDFDAHTIRVFQRIDRYGEVGWPKSEDGQRTIPVPPIVINALREWKLKCPKGKLGLVFPNGAGNPQNHQNMINRFLQPMQVRAGIVVSRPKMTKEGPELDDAGNVVMEDAAKYTGLHCLRHFFASWCINRKSAGGLELPVADVQYRMGHSSIQQTVDTYGHLFPSKDETESLDEATKQLLSAVRAT